MRSKIRWFTEFCNSHYVSHFAAFFIVARAKLSVVEGCLWLVRIGPKPSPSYFRQQYVRGELVVVSASQEPKLSSR